MPYRPSIAGTLAALVVMLASPLTRAETTEAGHRLYRQYCGACHGPEGHGDGVASSMMRPPPPDLTRLAARHGGQFPMETVVKTIDGRDMPRAHGEPAMPVWGEIFRHELGDGSTHPRGIERRVHERIYAIAEYLRSIQAK
jgi:mono/diheme cytochrome c family protein